MTSLLKWPFWTQIRLGQVSLDPPIPHTVTSFIAHETGMGVPDCSYENISKTFI